MSQETPKHPEKKHLHGLSDNMSPGSTLVAKGSRSEKKFRKA